IGGIGMSGIAELLLNLHYTVSGSDIKETAITRRLAGLGGVIHAGHAPDWVAGADVVVYSSAVRRENPELVAAREQGIPVIRRAEMLAELMRLKYGIAISGSHGKTTTTSMVAAVLAKGGLDPTVVIGGKLKGLGSNAKLGSGDFLVAEADESDGSFLKMSPAIAVVTNVDREHMDHYTDMDHVKNSFVEFVDRVPFYGMSILCLDDPAVQDILPRVNKRHVTYGLTPQADVRATNLEACGPGARFCVERAGKQLGFVDLNLPGRHNVNNALAAVAVGLELGIDFSKIAGALASLEGVARRMEVKGEKQSILVLDDYGHHPTEIAATLAAVHDAWPGRRVLVVFQPHRYSRTMHLFKEFARAFYLADKVLILPIYAAGEDPIEGIDEKSLCSSIRTHGHKNASVAESFAQAVEK
ncbi:MAG: UDP-N-acetylmuramate--L-alanine ligase, partial [Desulfatibacillaceae bacterium]|nr:UDP-N-acetylmuramate--L-alanine ligase [Desulfatibacillaceae bacterium]